MQVSFRTLRCSRAAARIALVACVAGALSVGSAALAQSQATSPNYRLAKAEFGIAPGAGFFINNPQLTRGLDDFKALGVHWILSCLGDSGEHANSLVYSTACARRYTRVA
jgi:hypothetical protein